jgi:hypothetical protein
MRRIFGAASLSLTYPFYKVDKCRDIVTSYFRDEERLRKLGNSAQSEALTRITWTWTGSDYQLHDSIALRQDFA